MPEYLQRRFGGERLRVYLSIIALITYLFATLSVRNNRVVPFENFVEFTEFDEFIWEVLYYAILCINYPPIRKPHPGGVDRIPTE